MLASSSGSGVEGIFLAKLDEGSVTGDDGGTCNLIRETCTILGWLSMHVAILETRRALNVVAVNCSIRR